MRRREWMGREGSERPTLARKTGYEVPGQVETPNFELSGTSSQPYAVKHRNDTLPRAMPAHAP